MAANPRAAAVAALVRQEQDGFSNLVLDAELKRQKLEGRDKAFASAIFYTVLEHRGTLDYILEQFLPKGLAKLDAPVREILRAALAQARYMQVPASAAVNEAVKLTRTFKKSSASGLVNAVLRKACGYDLDAAVFTDEIQRLMVLGSAGRDVAEFLHKNYPDEALDILTYQADGGLTSLRANPLKASAAQLCALLTEQGAAEVRQGIVPGSVLARFAGSPADNELFRQGYYHVEGQASQLAALCVGAAPGETVLDLCAAPGGKTILLAEQMQGTGTLYSCDTAENRVGLIRTAVDRMGFTGVHTLRNDATKPNPALPMADRILTDVPCSGLGILAKKPDLRYKKLEADRQAELLAIQAAILDTAAALLKAGGRLVYSTCTIDPAENQQQIAAFLQRHPEFAVCAPEVPLPAGMTAGEYGCLSGSYPVIGEQNGTKTLYFFPDAGRADRRAESSGAAGLPGKADLPLGTPETGHRIFCHDRPAQDPAGKAGRNLLYRCTADRASSGGQGRYCEVSAAHGGRQLHRDRCHALPLRQYRVRVHAGGLPHGLPVLRLHTGGAGAQP